ncbi:MAG: hypothetical protein WAO02_08050 [Verrucomicrobiia bacterium]
MVLFSQITNNLASPAVQVAVVVAGCLVLYEAFKIGLVVLKIALGLVVLVLLGDASWWFLSGINH